jgi:hypothetical protein
VQGSKHSESSLNMRDTCWLTACAVLLLHCTTRAPSHEEQRHSRLLMLGTALH